MSTEQNKAVLRRWFEAQNEGNLVVLDKLADELCTADFVFHSPGIPAFPAGPEAAKQLTRQALAAFPGMRVSVEDMVAEGDRVASRFTAHYTDASTGKPVTGLGMDISRFVGGKFAEEWQLGVPAGEAHDPVAVVKAFDAASNAGDLERLMALFTDDAVVRDRLGEVHTGKQQIREWYQPQMGHFHVASRNHRVTGNTVTWEATLTGDMVRQMGSDAIEDTAEAIVQGGKITSFVPSIAARKP